MRRVKSLRLRAGRLTQSRYNSNVRGSGVSRGRAQGLRYSRATLRARFKKTKTDEATESTEFTERIKNLFKTTGYEACLVVGFSSVFSVISVANSFCYGL